MTPSVARSDAVQATLFTTLGALLLFGVPSLPLGAPVVAVALLVVAVLVLTGHLRGPAWLGVALLVTAAVTMVDNPVGRLLDDLLVPGLQMLAGGLLVALGVLRLLDVPETAPARIDEAAPEAS